MEFCPEIAVLESAFQLVQNQAGKKLESLSKTECADYVLILKTTLEEICQGLEHDLDYQEQLLWQQNMHTLILYALIKKMYKPIGQTEGLPVYSPLDVLVQAFPRFSCHLYFELVKECSWEHLIVASLPYLDSAFSTQLLQDLMEHCTQDPVTDGDCKIINCIREDLLANLLSVPFEFDSALEKQLKPLSKPDKFIPLPKETFDDVMDVQGPRYASGTVDKLTEDGNENISLDKKSNLHVSQEMLADSFEVLGGSKDAVTDSAKADQPQDPEVQIVLKADGGAKYREIPETDLINGKLFWGNILGQKHSFLEELLLFTETHVNSIQTFTENLCCLAQLGLIGFVLTMKSCSIKGEESSASSNHQADIPYQWFVFNLFHKDFQSESDSNIGPMSELSLAYIVDLHIADQIAKQVTNERWLQCVHKVLKNIIGRVHKVVQDSTSIYTENKDTVEIISDDQQNFEEVNSASAATAVIGVHSNWEIVDIVSGLCLYKNVLLRMMLGCLADIASTVNTCSPEILKEFQAMLTSFQCTTFTCKNIHQETSKHQRETVQQNEFEKTQTNSSDSDLTESMKIGCFYNVDCCSMNTESPKSTTENRKSSVKFGVTWLSDITLESLCWRIKYNLPYCQECVELLLYARCQEFWLNERVYDVFIGNIQLLSVRERVMKLFKILKNLEHASGEVILKAQYLTCTAFKGLSFLNQDTVAAEMYLKDETMKDYLGLEDVQLMTVFNRITALRDDQILGELFLLCLRDPIEVMSTAVRMSVKNKEQAKNFAQVLQFFPNICQAVHPTHHPDSTLLGHVIKEFLLANRLADKEQSSFTVFLSTLLQVPVDQRKVLLLSPVELMDQSILPFIGVHTLYNSGAVACKFALTLLKTVLESECTKTCDWSKFKPIGLHLCLAELLQECVVLWDGENEVDGQTKIVVKTLVIECLKLLTDIIHKEIIPTDASLVESFQHSLPEFDFLVVKQLKDTTHFFQVDEFNTDYLQAFQQMLKQPDKYLSSLLVIVSFSDNEQELMDITEAICHRTRQLDYDHLIATLIQVLPNMLNCEFEKTVRYVMSLIDRELLPVPYRVRSSVHIPLTALKGYESFLGISQLLHDVIITLGFLSDRSDMMNHVLQCYIACLKSLMSSVTSSKSEVNLYILSQMFHHVCDIVQLLPQQTAEPVLVLLLNLLTLFTDTVENSQGISKTWKWRERMLNNIMSKIQLSVDNLPDSLVEKEMLSKKILKLMQ